MQVKELGHLVLYVRNLERSRRFYRDVLGWKEITVPGEEIGFPAAAFTSGRTHHELLLIEVGAYWGGTPHLFKTVALELELNEGRHYHVPLLISPFSCTTYRGT